jgi:propionyl-CoA carboxylase beta chain
MGPEGAINILYRGKLTDEQRVAAVDDYREKFANPYRAAALGYIDEIILPQDSRSNIIQALHMTQNKRKSNLPRKHGNIPL